MVSFWNTTLHWWSTAWLRFCPSKGVTARGLTFDCCGFCSNVCLKKTGTNCSTVSQLQSVPVFLKQTLFWILSFLVIEKKQKKIGPHFQILMQALPTSSPWRAFTTLSYYWMMLYYYILSFVCYAYWLLLYLEEKTNNSIYRYYVPNESLTLNNY